jgi:hypothetical protein
LLNYRRAIAGGARFGVKSSGQAGKRDVYFGPSLFVAWIKHMFLVVDDLAVSA